MHTQGINTARVPKNDRRYGFVIRMGAAHNNITRLDYWHGTTEKAELSSRFGKHLVAHATEIVDPARKMHKTKKAA